LKLNKKTGWNKTEVLGLQGMKAERERGRAYEGREREGTNSVQGLNSSRTEGDGLAEHLRLLTDANDEMKVAVTKCIITPP
jgi:hypothetical protein